MDIHDRLTAAVISYNASTTLRTCLRSLRTHLPRCKIVVWDNGSVDDSVAMVRLEFPGVGLISSPENLLFAEGCNHLIQHCQSPYVLLMNADVFLEDDRILDILPFLDRHGDVIAVSPAVRDGGRLRHLAHGPVTPWLTIARDTFVGKLLRRTGWYRRAMFDDVPADDIFPVPKITNCCCILRREEFLAVGGFNPGQLLYCTEDDFALRVQQAGYKQAVYGKCAVVHEHGSSTRTLPYSLLRAIVVRDRIAYIRRNFGLLAAAIVELAVFLRPKIWHSIYDCYCFWRHLLEMNRMATVVEAHRHIRLHGPRWAR